MSADLVAAHDCDALIDRSEPEEQGDPTAQTQSSDVPGATVAEAQAFPTRSTTIAIERPRGDDVDAVRDRVAALPSAAPTDLPADPVAPPRMPDPTLAQLASAPSPALAEAFAAFLGHPGMRRWGLRLG